MKIKPPAFIHSRLDDYGLPSSVFRVYCHLSRRAAPDRPAFPSIARMALVCLLHVQTVRKALRTLEQQRMITRENRQGETSLYRLTPIEKWAPPLAGLPSALNTPPSDSRGTPAKSRQASPSETSIAKGNPVEGDTIKEYPHSPPEGERVMHPVLSSVGQAEAIYEAYPKKVGKPAALRAILRALEGKPAGWLLERTKLFAQTCDREQRYIPNPANFFRDERYADDPSTWRQGGSSNELRRMKLISADQFGKGVSKL